MTKSSGRALQIDRLMRRIHADLHPHANQFDHERVGPIGGMLLLTIGEDEPIDLHSVIVKLGRDKSQITRLIQGLERKGLVEKHRSPQDARSIRLSLTSAGRRQLQSIQSALAGVIDTLFEPLTPEQTDQFFDILSHLLEASEK